MNGHLHYPNDIYRSLIKVTTDKFRKYHTDYNNNPLTLSPFCLLFLVRLGGYIVNLCDFYSYRLIGKLTVILQLQEFRLRNMTVSSSTISERLPHVCHK
jgi:hypothetical protein